MAPPPSALPSPVSHRQQTHLPLSSSKKRFSDTRKKGSIFTLISDEGRKFFVGGRDKGSFYLRQNDAFYALSPSSEFPPPLMDRCNNLLSYSSLLRQKPCSLKPLERERGCRFPTKQTNVPRGGGGGGGREGWGNEYVTCGEAGEREVSACFGEATGGCVY